MQEEVEKKLSPLLPITSTYTAPETCSPTYALPENTREGQEGRNNRVLSKRQSL